MLLPNYTDLIGKPFQYGGRGPDVFDCYGLVMELHRRVGKHIPDVLSPTEQAKIASLVESEVPTWTPCERAPGAVLTMRIGRHVSHVAMILSGTKFIHVWSQGAIGVAVERISEWERRIVGCYRYTR